MGQTVDQIRNTTMNTKMRTTLVRTLLNKELSVLAMNLSVNIL